MRSRAKQQYRQRRKRRFALVKAVALLNGQEGQGLGAERRYTQARAVMDAAGLDWEDVENHPRRADLYGSSPRVVMHSR